MTAAPATARRPVSTLCSKILRALFLLLCLSAVQKVSAQQTGTRFLFILQNPDPAQEPALTEMINANGGTVGQQIKFPDLGFIAQVGEFPQPVAIVDNDPRVRVVRDVLVYSSGGPLGAGWVQNQFKQPAGGTACNDTPPVVYIVDTGISSTHADFTWPPGDPPALTFQPGWSYAKHTPSGMILPEYPDNHDHGTRIAGCLGGRTTGLLGALGARADVKSIAIFDTPAPGNILATWASQAINGVLRAVSDHKARRADPYLKSRASVLVFAHATRLVDGRFAALDNAIEKAWQAGMHVVMSAGNEGVNAALVSPAGAAWGYTIPPGAPVRFWSGALPAGAVLFRAAPEFTVAGGYELVGGNPALWALSNLNVPPAAAVDGFAPAVNVPCASSGAPPFLAGNGTSYAAAYAAAMLTWEAWQRPWATPDQARTWLNASMQPQPGGWMKLETPTLPAAGLTFAEWIEAFYPLATSTPAERDPGSDPDADGTANFIEYFCGGDPRIIESGFAPEITVSAGLSGMTAKVRLPMACHLPPAPQVRWALEASTDLTHWTPAAVQADLTRLSPPQIVGDGTRAEATVSFPATPRRVARVKFSYVP